MKFVLKEKLLDTSTMTLLFRLPENVKNRRDQERIEVYRAGPNKYYVMFLYLKSHQMTVAKELKKDDLLGFLEEHQCWLSWDSQELERLFNLITGL